MNTANLIKLYRKEAKMTQEQVAKQLFIAKNTYSQYENGVRKMESEMFLKILDVLGIQVEFNIEQLEDPDVKSIVVYKDTTYPNPRFQIELYEYDPIRKKRFSLENVNGGISYPGWLEGKDAMDTLEFVKREFKDIIQIDWETYQTFDFISAKNMIQSSSTFTCSLSFLTRVFQKCIEEEWGFVPFFEANVDEEYIYFDLGTKDKSKEKLIGQITDTLYDEEVFLDWVDSFFFYYFNKSIRKRFFDQERDTFTFIF